MKSAKQARSGSKTFRPEISVAVPEKIRWFQLVVGLWLSIALLKFGNPAILGGLVIAPADFTEFLFIAWPLTWGYVLLAIVGIWGYATGGLLKKPFIVPAFLFAWLAWQYVSSTKSIDPALTRVTLIYFSMTAVAFLIGWTCLSNHQLTGWFWWPLTLGFAYMLWTGIEQHYGGLEATRRSIYTDPNWQALPPEFLAKIASNRIFGTLFYPNALAGAILLLGPVTLWKVWELTIRWPRHLRMVALASLLLGSLACLYWTESRGGWLIAIAVGVIAFLHLDLNRKMKIGFALLILLVGLGGFFIRYSSYFKKGATSATARMEYWQAAIQTFQANPLLGSGPGTFGPAYKKVKRPEAEMARLTHNDYLQQASDSGALGAATYLGFIGSLSFYLYRKRNKLNRSNGFILAGLLAFLLQSFLEFNLYLPALAWPFMVLAGDALGRINETISSGDSNIR